MPGSVTPSFARARLREAARSAIATLVAVLAVATIQGCENLNVTAIDVAEIEIQPKELSLPAGDSLPLVAALHGEAGTPLPNRPVSWSSDDPSVASVRSDGMVTGVAPGVTQVRAASGQARGTATVTVVHAPRITMSERTVRFETGPLSATPVSRAVGIENGGGGQLSDLAFTLTHLSGEPEGWLAVSLAGTTAPTSLTLSASTSGVGAGVYRADVEIRSPRAENSPEVLEVELVVGDGDPSIEVSPSALGFAAEVGQAAPPSQTVQVENSGGGELGGLDVSISYKGSPTGWLGASLEGDEAPADLVVSVAPEGLVAGMHEASVLVTSAAASNSPRALSVRLTVGGLPAWIELDPRAVDFEVTQDGPTPSSRTVRVENDGGGSLGGLSASVSYGSGVSGWLEAELGSSSAPADLTLSVTETDLTPGTYRATVGVRSSQSANSPQSVTVRLKVEEGGGDSRSAQVATITYRTTGGPSGDRHLGVTVSIRDEDGKPVGNARVIASIRNDRGGEWSREGETGSDGDVTFQVNNHPPGCYVTTVTTVDVSDLEWNGNTPANAYCKS